MWGRVEALHTCSPYHRGPRHMGLETSFGVRPQRPPAALRRGPPSRLDHRGPRRMGLGASTALGPTRPPPHGRGALLCFGVTGVPVASGRVPPPFGEYRPPRCIRAEAPSYRTHTAPVAFGRGLVPYGPPGPLSLRIGGLHRIDSTPPALK